MDPSVGEPMSKIIIVIDEFADLMLQVKDPVESLVMRIAQKARAAGIHLIIGTQRPSTNVITGTIKANIPSRISCKVASNVDSRTEIRIQQAMEDLMKNKTCFIIAHRLSTIQNADTILVVKDGTVIEQGNHAELIAKGGFYSTLYNSQFS